MAERERRPSAEAPRRFWRDGRWVGVVEGVWDAPSKSFGMRARIRAGRTSRRVLWEGPWRDTETEARLDMEARVALGKPPTESPR